MSEAVKKDRRQFGKMSFAQALQYRLPPAGVVSIFHRLSGGLMFVLLPFVLFLLDKSLTSEISFNYLKNFTSGWFVKLLILALSWAYLHHFCAGIRHLLMDVHMGLDKESGRKSAITVFAISIPLAILVGLKLFGAF